MADNGNNADDGYGVYSRPFDGSDPRRMEAGKRSVSAPTLPFSLVAGAEVGSLTARDNRLNKVSLWVSIALRSCRLRRGLRESPDAASSVVGRRWFVYG